MSKDPKSSTLLSSNMTASGIQHHHLNAWAGERGEVRGKRLLKVKEMECKKRARSKHSVGSGHRYGLGLGCYTAQVCIRCGVLCYLLEGSKVAS